MIDPTVRLATVDDADALVALQDDARRALADQRGGARWLEEHPPHEWATTLGRDVVLVAHVDDVPIGYLVLDRSTPRIARIEQVYVAPGARDVGFGDELLATALDLARAGDAEFLEAEALPGDRNTKNLYERAGITARSITVSTRLVP